MGAAPKENDSIPMAVRSENVRFEKCSCSCPRCPGSANVMVRKTVPLPVDAAFCVMTMLVFDVPRSSAKSCCKTATFGSCEELPGFFPRTTLNCKGGASVAIGGAMVRTGSSVVVVVSVMALGMTRFVPEGAEGVVGSCGDDDEDVTCCCDC